MNETSPGRTDLRVLVLAPTARDAELSRSALEDAGFACQIELEVPTLVEALGEGAGAVLLTEDLLSSGDLVPLIEALRRQPNWSDLPILLLADEGADSPKAVEAKDQLGNVTVLERPIRLTTLVSALRAALRARCRQYQLRDQLEALRQSEERFRTLAINSPVAIFVKDLAGRYTIANPLASEALGRPDGVIGYSDHDLMPPDVAEQLRRNDLEVIETGQALEREEALQIDGLRRDFLSVKFPLRGAGGEIVGVCGVAVDITARKSAEEGLRESEEQFRLLSNTIPQLAWMARADGHIFWYNRRWYEYTGRTPPEMEGWGWQSVHDPAELPRVLESWRTALAAAVPWEDTFPIRRHDGAMRWHLSRALPLKDVDGRVLRWFGTNTDITEMRRMEDALRDADRRKDEFLATLAHELRNPLAPIRSSLQILRLPGADPGAQAWVIDVMERQVDHLVRLVDDLLEVSRITRGMIELRKETVLLEDVLQRAIETSRPLLEASGHEFVVELPDEPLLLEADAVRLAQVISNLLNNSAKYTDRGGRVELRVRREDAEVVIRVRDNGLGIPPEMLPKVFEMFTQVDPSRGRAHGGLGIGLTLVRSLVQLHGGRLEAYSEGPGRGSEFVVRLPIRVNATVTALRRGDRGEDLDVRGREILLVDDNRDAAQSLAALLRLLGARVRVAHDGRAALEAALEQPPSLILLDIGMPGMDGYEVARRLRARPEFAATPLVALTGWGQVEDRRRSVEAGFDYHLVKPVTLETLKELLAEAASR